MKKRIFRFNWPIANFNLPAYFIVFFKMQRLHKLNFKRLTIFCWKTLNWSNRLIFNLIKTLLKVCCSKIIINLRLRLHSALDCVFECGWGGKHLSVKKERKQRTRKDIPGGLTYPTAWINHQRVLFHIFPFIFYSPFFFCRPVRIKKHQPKFLLN